MAQRGIDSVADELLVEAERALMELDLTRLASAIDAVRSARPDHPRLEFFVTQLERERELQSGQAGPGVDTMRPSERKLAASAARLPPVRVQACCSSRTTACAASSSTAARTARTPT